MHVCMYEWMYVCMCVSMNVGMYVYITDSTSFPSIRFLRIPQICWSNRPNIQLFRVELLYLNQNCFIYLMYKFWSYKYRRLNDLAKYDEKDLCSASLSLFVLSCLLILLPLFILALVPTPSSILFLSVRLPRN